MVKKVYWILFNILYLYCITNTTNLFADLEQNCTLKILFKVHTFPALVSSAVLNKMVGLIQDGHEVYIYADQIGQVPEIHPLVKQYDLLNKVSYGRPPADLHSYDIIYAQNGGQGRRALKLKKDYDLQHVKLVTTFVGSDCSTKFQENPRKYDALFKEGDLFLPVCEYFKDRLIEYGCDPHTIKVHHSAIDTEKFSFRPRRLDLTRKKIIRFGVVGRLIVKKGIKYSLRALAKVRKFYPFIEFVIVGSGSYESILRKYVKKLGLEDIVFFTGRASQDEVADILDTIDIFLHPSITGCNGDQEGIPNAIKEAMARGIPVISTYHSGIEELIENNVSGFLVPERDAKAIAEKIKFLIENPHIWYELECAARRKIEEEYSLPVVNHQMITYFMNIVSPKE